MAVIYRVIERPADPRDPQSPKRFYPYILTLGNSVDFKHMAQRISDRSSLSIGDVRSSIQNFVELVKQELLEGKTVNIEGLGVFYLAAKSKGEETAKEVTANSVEGVRICFQANKELRINKHATRAGEKLKFISLDDYLKGIKMTIPTDDDGGDDSGDINVLG